MAVTTVAALAAVRVAAASLSKLLAEDDLVGDAWERAVTVLARYRVERTRLAKEVGRQKQTRDLPPL